ncbi:MAG TPA: sugar ABC transporter permease [Candidatus Goldiibacteriota bacterium]|nr:sugar ABC transporter permease [Candidatus Goldiibacteriota bacterium]
MADNIFNKVGSDLTETTITSMLDEEIKVHKKESPSLPIIKLKLPPKESVVKIKEKKKPEESIFDVLKESEVKEKEPSKTEVPYVTITQEMRKDRRYHRFGKPLKTYPLKRPQTPLPVLKKEEVKKQKIYRFKKEMAGVELLTPALIIFLLFSWIPIIKTFIISMQKITSMHSVEFIGMDNFLRILTDVKFWEAFGHSVGLSLLVIAFGAWIPFFIALYVYEMKKGSGLVKVLYFLPFLTPAVPAAILWKWIYNQGFGMLNSLISLFVPGDVHIGWLTDPRIVLFSIAAVFIWKNIGWALLIYLAGLQNIPKTLFEDASLNGASIWQKIKEIILPSIVPVIATVVFLQMISGLQVFTEVYIMTNGGPGLSSEVIATYIYKKAFLYMDIGYAAGVAVFFLFILVSITLFRMNVNLKRG